MQSQSGGAWQPLKFGGGPNEKQFQSTELRRHPPLSGKARRVRPLRQRLSPDQACRLKRRSCLRGEKAVCRCRTKLHPLNGHASISARTHALNRGHFSAQESNLSEEGSALLMFFCSVRCHCRGLVCCAAAIVSSIVGRGSRHLGPWQEVGGKENASDPVGSVFQS